MSNDSKTLFDNLVKQEEKLVFKKFDVEDAVTLGMRLYKKAKDEGKVIAFNISLNRRNLFHLSMDGCSADNDQWLIRKENMVYRFFQSSQRTVALMEMMGMDFYSFYGVGTEYVPAGGGFPINIAGTGVVGCISLGGMVPPQDHQFIVDVLEEYIS